MALLLLAGRRAFCTRGVVLALFDEPFVVFVAVCCCLLLFAVVVLIGRGAFSLEVLPTG